MTLKLYFDLLSQPSRALYITLKLHNIPFEAEYVNVGQGEHLTEEFSKNVSRFKKLPVINDDGFNLTESVGILRYLARTKQLPENWYSQEPKKQALIDEYLEWQHNNTRTICSLYFQRKFMFPRLFGKITSPEKLKPYLKNVEDCLKKIEELWLTPGPYINGHGHLTAADLWAAVEIEQLKMAGYDPREGRPKLAAWLDRVRNETNPYYDEAHQLLNEIAEVEMKETKSKL